MQHAEKSCKDATNCSSVSSLPNETYSLLFAFLQIVSNLNSAVAIMLSNSYLAQANRIRSERHSSSGGVAL